MYEFPVIETQNETDFTTIRNEIEEKFSDKNIIAVSQYNDKLIIHKLSHQKLHINFFKVEIKTKLEDGMDLKTLKKMPFPIVIHNFIEKYSI